MRVDLRAKARRALIEGLSEAIATFAYLDVKITAGRVHDWSDRWSFCAQVVCDRGAEQGSLLLVASDSLALASAAHFLGTSTPSERIQVDLVGELANVLAGRAFEWTIPGRRPHSISTPRPIEPSQAHDLWRRAPGPSRFLVQGETAPLGALILIPGIGKETSRS